MSAHVVLNLSNKLGKRNKIYFNKYNDTGAQMLDSVYDMTSKFIKNCILA